MFVRIVQFTRSIRKCSCVLVIVHSFSYSFSFVTRRTIKLLFIYEKVYSRLLSKRLKKGEIRRSQVQRNSSFSARRSRKAASATS